MKRLTTIWMLLALPLLALRAQDAAVANGEPSTTKLDLTEILKSSQTFTNSVGMEMIPSGNLWAGKYEVTQDAYNKVTGGNPSHFAATNRPVDSVSWNNAMDFCRKLTEMERKESNLPTNFVYTLPTEAQWETLVADASLDDSVTSQKGMGARKSTEPVGSLKPNSLGLYDTRGNVMEFTLDWHDPSQTYRVLRGGGYDAWFEVNLRTVFRHYAKSPDAAQDDFGFRCVLVKQTPPPADR